MNYKTSLKFLVLVSFISAPLFANDYNIGDCTDSLACNYNEFAIEDDGSCIYPSNSSLSLSVCDVLDWNGAFYNTSGVYTYTTENSEGCDSIVTLNLTINNSPTILFQKQDLLCFGDTTGFIDLSVTSINGGDLTYIWNNNQNLEDLTNLSAGTYTVTVIDTNLCSSNQNILISEPSLIENYTEIQLCFGDSVSIGNNTYKSSGSYVDTLFSANGCDSIQYTELLILNPLLPGLIGESEDICFDSSPSSHDLLSPAIGADGNYSYLWEESVDGVIFSSAIQENTNTSYQSESLVQSTYYRLEISSDYGCGTVYTNIVKDSVYNELTAPVISSSQSICYASSPELLTMDIAPTGGGDITYSYEWQESLNGIDWNDLSENDITYQSNTLTTSTYFRLSATSSFDCGPIYSEPVYIEVYLPLESGEISSTQNICFGTVPAELSFNIASSGADGNYTYLWEQSTDGIIYEPSTQFNTGTTYQSESLTESTYYRVQVSSTYGCGTDSTTSILVNVYSPLLPGLIGESEDICFDSSPSSHDLLSPAIGADGNYSYLWEESVDGVIFSSAIQENTNTSYQSESLVQSTYYRLEISSDYGCGTVYTNIVKDSVYNELTAPVISSSQSICYASSPELLTMDIAPTGGGDITYSYEWQESLNGIDWNDLSENDITYQSNTLTTSTYFRLSATSSFDCGPIYSEPVYIEVYLPLESGEISSTQNICFGTVPAELSFNIASSGADGNYTYLWEQSTDGIIYEPSTQFNTGTTYQSESLTESTYYRVQVSSTYGCGTDSTTSILVNVYNEFLAGQITLSDTICYGEIPNEILLTSTPTGANFDFSYQWLLSDGFGFDTIDAETSTMYSSNELFNTTYFKLIINSNLGCGSLETNACEVIVNPLPESIEIIGDQVLCANSTDVNYALDSLYVDIYYNWTTDVGDFIGSSQTSECNVHFDANAVNGELSLLQTNSITGCQLLSSLPLEIIDDYAPDKSLIIKKYNSNILISSDSSAFINYQWGYSTISTGSSFNFEGETLQYIQLLDDIDTLTNRYWVDTYFDESSCTTRSYYNPPDELLEIIDDVSVIGGLYPNPTSGYLYFETKDVISLDIYNSLGQKINPLVDLTNGYLHLNHYETGIYFIEIRTVDRVLIEKIILR